MKNFFVGVLVTVIGGIIVMMASNAWTTWRSERAQVIWYQVASDRLNATPQLISEVRAASSGDVFEVVTVVNRGAQDLENVSYRIAPLESQDLVKAVGTMLAIGDADEPTLKLDKGGAMVSYRLLRKGQGTRFFVRLSYGSDLKVLPLMKGLAVDEDDPDSFWSEVLPLFEFAGVLLVGLILGAAIIEAGNRHTLRKIGLDPAEVQKLYLDAIKKKQDK